jgi:hypothetical protein
VRLIRQNDCPDGTLTAELTDELVGPELEAVVSLRLQADAAGLSVFTASEDGVFRQYRLSKTYADNV